jgi:nicotinate phosphoribosyltransferase
MAKEFDILPKVLVGGTSEASIKRTSDILRKQGVNPKITVEFISREEGVFCGIGEVTQLLTRNLPEAFRDDVWSLNDGDIFQKNEVLLRISSTYAIISQFITAINGFISSSSGWATAAKECVDAADGIPIVNFGVSQIHPNVAGIMDYSSIQGGAKGCSSLAGADLSDLTPAGSMDESLVLLSGDVVEAAESLVANLESELPKVVSIGIIGDETEEAKKIVENFPSIRGLKIETPPERAGNRFVIKEVRERLDQLGFSNTQLSVSGDFNPKSISQIIDLEKEWQVEISKISITEMGDSQMSPNLNRRIVQVIGIDRYIACHEPINISPHIKVIDGNPVAKRGQVPGLISSQRLLKVEFE